MGRLFVLFFLLPWWAYVPASLGVLWVGERIYERALESEAEKVAALEAGAPEPVDLADFDMFRDIHAADEVHVTGRIDPERKYELVKQRNGITTNTRYMYMMFGSADPTDTRAVRAALMLTKKENEVFLDRGDDFIVGLSNAGELVFAFNGYGDSYVTMGDMAADAIDEQGLVQSEDFIFVEPFLEGREAALAAHGIPEQSRYIGWLIAAVVALIGVVKRVRSVRARLSRDAQEAIEPAEVAEIAPRPATSFAVPDGVSLDTPLGRLARRNAPHMAASHDDPTCTQADERAPALPDPVRDLDDEATGIRVPPAEEEGAHAGGDARSPFPPIGEFGDMPAPAPAPQPSVLAYYFKLLLAMLVVGAIAYDPSLLNAALPVAAIALFWFSVFVVVRKLRGPRAAVVGGDATAAQPVDFGVGGQGIDLTAPVRRSRRERGVI